MIGLLLLIAAGPGVDAQSRVQCLSGNCERGEGEAYLAEHVYYKGTFKNGKPDGQGYHAQWGWAYTGGMKAGWRDGYGVSFESLKGSDGRYRADSTKPVIIGIWSTGVLMNGIRIDPDGTETYHTSNGFVNGKRPADPWMAQQADGYQAALARKGIVRKPAGATVLRREGYQCVSGDCQNGTGTAVKYQPDGTMDIYYSGKFENGHLIDGTRINYSWAYVGHFRNDEYDGYGARFDAKKAGQDYVIDSTKSASFSLWKDGKEAEAVVINRFGERHVKHKGEWSDGYKMKDDWINQHADAYMAARAGTFEADPTASEERLLLGKGRVNVARNNWSKVIQWQCLPDRSYYVGVENKSNHGYLPFAGVAVLQISDDGGKVVAEGEISRANPGMRWNSMPYWRPSKEGNYTFLVRFYQEEITGGRREDYVDGVQLGWELHSYKK